MFLTPEEHARLTRATAQALHELEQGEAFQAAVRPARPCALEVFVVYPGERDAVSVLRRAGADALNAASFAAKDGDDPEATRRALLPYAAYDIRLLAVRHEPEGRATIVGAMRMLSPTEGRMPYSLTVVGAEWGHDVAQTVARTRLPSGAALPASVLRGHEVFDIAFASVREERRLTGPSADERVLLALYNAALRVIRRGGGRYVVGAVDVEGIYLPLKKRGPGFWTELHGIERKRILSRVPASNVSTAVIADVRAWEADTAVRRKLLHGLLWGELLSQRGVVVTGVPAQRAPLFDAMPDNPRLAPAVLRALPYPTPFLYVDLDTVGQRLRTFQRELPGVDVHYAMKCNPDRALLSYLHRHGCRFEIASRDELAQLVAVGVDPSAVLFSNPVRDGAHTRYAAQRGVSHFAFDSEDELESLAQHAPGARVYVRLTTPCSHSKVHSEGKFGVDVDAALALMCRARARGLAPYGIAFHVGSQVEDPELWRAAIQRSGALMRALQEAGITLSMLDLGGGFPAFHALGLPSVAAIAAVIREALASELPYRPARLVIEPGRGLVSDAGAMVSTVIGVIRRGDATWVHLDLGGFTMLEALETGHTLDYPVADSRQSKQRMQSHITAATCDSMDTILYANEALSADLARGDRVFLYTAGAYTTSYASRFNGFAQPPVHYAEPRDGGESAPELGALANRAELREPPIFMTNRA